MAGQARDQEQLRHELGEVMLGLGETRGEVLSVLADLRAAGVGRLSLGQYLRPSLDNLPVARYVSPDEFARYETDARAMGFAWVKAGPLVRSSYYAEEPQYPSPLAREGK